MKCNSFFISFQRLMSMKNILSRINKKIYLGLFLIGGGVIYLKVFIPVTGLSIPCVFNHVTGLYCPGCGMTRASLALFSGDIYQSFRYNMLIFILLPLLILFYVLEKKGKVKLSQSIMFGMLVITIAFGILRNLEPFSWLAPNAV